MAVDSESRNVVHYSFPDSTIDRALLASPTLILLCAVLLRCCVGLFPHSGQGDPPLFGDFEAQRHWLEITVGTPLHQWYHNTTDNDLMYWGLDYPPLTAFVSYGFGKLANVYVPDTVALHESRGSETQETRSFMRATVVFCDILVYFSSAWYFCAAFYSSNIFVNKSQPGFLVYRRTVPETGNPKTRSKWNQSNDGVPSVALVSEIYLLVLLQPGLVIIDHGHFQYNSASLGLALWAVVCFLYRYEALGSVFFCLSLNFKQISLYYAPAVFFYLLSRSLKHAEGQYPRVSVSSVLSILRLGIAVITTFTILWFPFCSARANAFPVRKTEACVEGLTQILVRIFPFKRGVFEDKVANFWCTLNIFVKLKTIIPIPKMATICLFATLLAFSPSCINLMWRKPGPRKLIWALFNCSLSFFLFSFQVHEKSILLPLMPMSLLAGEIPGPSCWFSLTAMFSMSPLLFRERLFVPYAVTTVLFLMHNILCFGKELKVLPLPWKDSRKGTRGIRMVDASMFLYAAGGIALLLQLASLFVTPPSRYPDLWPVLISAYASCLLCLAWLYGNWYQLMLVEETDVVTKLKAN